MNLIEELRGSPERAHIRLAGLANEFGQKAAAKGLEFGPAWIDRALDFAATHARKQGNRPIQDASFLATVMTGFLAQGGPPPARRDVGSSSGEHFDRAAKEKDARDKREHADEQARITRLLEQIPPLELEALRQRAIESLPAPMIWRNPTLDNSFIRSKVYELACGGATDMPNEAAKPA
jgi:hypothetical protein